MAVVYIALGAGALLALLLWFPFPRGRNELDELDDLEEEADEAPAAEPGDESIDKLILRPRGGSFAVEEIRSQLLTELSAVEESEGSDVFFLLAEGVSHDGLEQFRDMHPDQLPYVGIVDLRTDGIVVHQNTGEGGRATCARFLAWLAQQGCVAFDELGREVAIDESGHCARASSGATLQSDETHSDGEADEAEFADLAKLTADASRSEQLRLHEPSQLASVYEFDDGTVVILRPKGTRHQPRPVSQIGVKGDPSRPYAGPEDVAFLLDDKARPVPKSLADAAPGPYSPESFQDLVYKRLIVEAGTRATAEEQDP